MTYKQASDNEALIPHGINRDNFQDPATLQLIAGEIYRKLGMILTISMKVTCEGETRFQGRSRGMNTGNQPIFTYFVTICDPFGVTDHGQVLIGEGGIMQEIKCMIMSQMTRLTSIATGRCMGVNQVAFADAMLKRIGARGQYINRNITERDPKFLMWALEEHYEFDVYDGITHIED